MAFGKKLALTGRNANSGRAVSLWPSIETSRTLVYY
jgi:hypothetical protein